MASEKARYEVLADDDRGPWSIADKYRSKSLEVDERTASPTESVRSDRKSIDWAISKPKPKPLPLDRFIHLCIEQPPFTKALVLTIITGLPFLIFLLVVIFALPDKKTANSDVTYLQIAVWLFSSWASFLVLFGLVRTLAKFASWFCSLSQYLIKYERFAKAITFRVVLLLWTAVTYAIIPAIFTHAAHWVQDTHTAFEYIMIAFAVFLGQGIILELLSIRYIQGWLGPRSQRAFDELETIKNLQSLVKPFYAADEPGMMTRVYKSLFVTKAIDMLYDQISAGDGDDDKWTSYAAILWNNIHDGKQSLTRFDLDQRLRSMNRDPAVAYVLFMQLNAACEGSVTQEAVEKLVRRVGYQLNIRNRAQRAIDSLLDKLNITLFGIVLAITFLLYFQFFQQSEASDIRMFWMSLSGISFAISSVLLEFTNNLIFVFGKHPYDVGDYIQAKDRKLIVTKIALTYSDFEEATEPGSSERGLPVQMSHSSLTSEPIINWTRAAETVLEKKKTVMQEDQAKEKEEKETEKAEKAEHRELVLLKSAQLRDSEVKKEGGA